jgi:hypothetical protein
MRCVCARIRTSFSCISICNLSARPEKGACSQAPFFSWHRRAKPDSASPRRGVRSGKGTSLNGLAESGFVLQLNRRFLVRAVSDPASPCRFPALRIYNDHVRFGRQQTARRVLPAIETDC